MFRRADLLGLLVGGGHPEGEAAAVDEGGGGEGEYVVEHGEEAIGLLGGDIVGKASTVSFTRVGSVLGGMRAVRRE